jgi:hypothetical protein
MTEPQSPFEDVPVVRVARPPDVKRVQAATLVVLAALVVLIAKPWGEPVGRKTAAASAAPSHAASVAPAATPVRTARPDGARQYDPALFGRFTVVPRWEIWPTLYVYQFGMSGPVAIDTGGPKPSPSASPPPAPAVLEPPTGAGQLIDVGSADLLMVLGLDTPADTRVLDARLWRFRPDGPPVRMALVELPPPWPVPYFHVYGLPVPGSDDRDLVAIWPTGTYRLDLLVDPGAEVRRIGLLVRPPIVGGPDASPADTTPPGAVDPATLRDLQRDQMALGGAGATWSVANLESSQTCGLPELWLAEQDRPAVEPCRSIIASDDIRMIGVRLGGERQIRSLSLDQVDPTERHVPVEDVTASVNLAPAGTAVISVAGDRPLAEGTYRVVAHLSDGTDVGWYIRVPPGGS